MACVSGSGAAEIEFRNVTKRYGGRNAAAESSREVLRLAAGYDVVGVDEAQFFDDGIVEVVQELVVRGARVVVAGLDTDFRHEPFGCMPTLLAIAELVDKLQAVCHRCGGTATRTQRLVDGRPAPFSGETIVVGALDSYEARCTACYEPGLDAPVRLSA